MADKYLQLSRDVVHGVRVQIENEELVVKLNGSQCKVLMKELVQTVKEIMANVASVPHKDRVYQQSCRAVLQELYRVVKDAEAIIHACCDENWVQAAIILVNIDEVFVDVLFRLDWCTSALGIVLQRAKSGPSSELQHVSKNIQAFGQVEQARAKMQEIRQMLRGHALEDRTTLRRRLQGLQKGTGAPDEQEIAATLLKFTDPAANILQDDMELASSLWSVTIGAITGSSIGAAAMGVAAAMGAPSGLEVGTSSAQRSQRSVHRNLVIMSRMDFPAISSTVLPGRNWLHSVKSQDLKEQKIISKGVVAEVSEVKWLGRTFARKSFKSISSYKFMLVAEKFARLSHPHVLQVFGHSVELGWSPSGSLVMELMYGDLRKLGLASRQLLVAVDTLLQIAEGMKYLHEQDIVHGDLNARNILINRVPIPEMEEAGYVHAKVAGFGVSGEPRTGTARWMAPELFEKQNSQPNQEQFMASDIYSYAVTCFEILTSKSPFAEAENQAEVKAAVKAGARPQLPESLPTSLQSLIRRCWDADASNRPSFSEICAELRKCKCDLMLNGDATLMEGAQGQLGVRMSRKVGAHEKPVGESPIITLGWRVAYEDNALEFFFHSAESMSSIVGVGLKFGKVVVSASNLEVKIIDIGKETWEAELSTFTALDNMLEVVSIDHAEMIGARSHKNSINKLNGNTVQSTDVPHDGDYCLVLHKIVEYLMLKKVDLPKIGKRCVGNGGAGSSSSGGRNPNQGNDGGSLSWIHAILSYWFGKAQSNSNNDGGDADTSKNQREKLAVDRANTKECKITVDASPKASFFDGKFQLPAAPTELLNEAAIKPTLDFKFVINSNGSKGICIETSVAFELGSAAPRSTALNGQFGWYQDPITFYLEGSEHASLLPSSCVLETDGSGEAPKATLKLIDTDANNFAREQDTSLTLGANMLVPTISTSATVKQINTTGKTSAQERNFERCTPEVWGFQHQNLFSSVTSKACHVLSHAPLGVSVLRDGPERQQCIASGLSRSIIPKFVAEWRIQESDKVQETYTFGAERMLNKLVKPQDSTREGSGEIHRCSWRQEYKLAMLVNHAMDHLCHVSGHVVLCETLSGGELRTPGSKLETHAMPTIDEIRTCGSRIEKLGTHDMPWNIATLGTNFLECQHESGPHISFCWRVAYEESTLELVFCSAASMSCVVGLGLEFAKVVVSTSTWEVKIIGIGQESWELMWTELTGLDKKHKVGGIFSVKMMGGGLQDDLTNEYLGGIESAQKYGVGLSSANNRAYVQSTNVLQERDHCLVLHKIVEYLMLEEVDLAKIGNQCAVSGEAGSSSRGANNSDQVNNDGTWIGQTLSNFQSKGKSKSNGDDDDNRSPSNKEPPKVEDESASKNTCKITVRPGAGGSFYNEAGRQVLEPPVFKPLNGASIDPTLVFVFDKNGSFGKQILVTTTTSFDLGKSAPRREWNGSFGWYHNLLVTSLTNLPKHAVLETTLCKLLMENPKDTKSSVKQIDTHTSTSTLEGSIDGRLGFQNTHIGGRFTSTETGGETSAREAAYENPSSSDRWRGFEYRDLSAPEESSACYDFDCSLQSPTLEVLKDPNERKRYMSSGMCGAVRPTFVGAWSILPDDTTEDEKYAFEAERTLKYIYEVFGEEKEQKFIQKYHVKMFVNHAMTHLCNVKGDHVLRERESVLKVMRVSARGI